MPVLVERGGPHGAAGAATAALFIGAVAGELFTPWLMSRWSSSRLLVGGQLMTAVPSLVYVVPHASAALMLAAACARGLGMGVAIVVSVVLVGEVAAPERRGRSIGYFGLALSAPGIVVPSIGVWLLEAGHVEVDALIAFGIGLVGALLVVSLPRAAAPTPGASTNLLSAFRRPGLLLIFAGFVMVSSSFGAVITFAPIALPATGIGSVAVFLFVAGAARAASRWVAGVLGDRRQGRLVLAASIGVTFVGLVALASRANPVVVVFAAVAFGGGYGRPGFERASQQRQRTLEQRHRPGLVAWGDPPRPRRCALRICGRDLGHPRRGGDRPASVPGAGQAAAGCGFIRRGDRGSHTLAVVGRRPEDHEDELLFDFVEVMGVFRSHE